MKFLLALFLLAAPLPAQPFSFGAKIGAPLTDAIDDVGGKNTFNHSTDRYVIGPMVELRLPFGIGIEADLLYRRYTLGGTVNHWEFPILAKYRFPGPIVHPYVAAGPSFNHVSDPGLFQDVRHSGSSGFALAGGVEVKALIIRLAPEIRYTHWTNTNIDLAPLNSGLSSSQNQVEFLVGITF
jgi:hypothetical protein